MAIAIGIDLGTTNSASCIKKVSVSPLYNAEGDALTPSCVSAVPNGDVYDVVVGRSARDLRKQYPQQTITSVKRLMGRAFEDTEIANIINNNHVSFTIETDPSEPGSIRIPLAGKSQTPEMISSLILSKLIRDGEAELKNKIDQAVVTVPAYFSDGQKFATRAACDHAGIKLLRLLSEPTAAALSFGLTELEEAARTVMVFDLGGGTFDVSVLSFAGGSCMEVTKGGDMWLGGDDIDNLLVDHVFACVAEQEKCKPIRELMVTLSPSDKARFLIEIKEKAEAAKIALSTQETVTIESFGVLKDQKNNLIDIDVTITRDQFSTLIQPMIEKITKIATQILHDIRFEPELIDTVLMVGGTSLIPAVQEALKTLFGEEKVLVHPRPMLAVAEGAALMAAKLVGKAEQDDFSMMHSTAHDYYLQLANGQRHLLAAKNTPLPMTVEQSLKFSHKDQKVARLRIFNDVDGVLETVGELWFHRSEDNKKNDETLTLSFSVDEDNIITMTAASSTNKKEAVSSRIARGGLAAKLYNDLESALSAVVARADDINDECEALILSRQIVSTILSVSDPATGQTNPDMKQKVSKQIQTLKACQEKDLSPMGRYKFALLAKSQVDYIKTGDGKVQLNDVLADYKTAIDNLDDIDTLLSVDEALDKLYEELPVIADLAQAEHFASLISEDYPGDAKKIRGYAKDMVAGHNKQDDRMLETSKDAIHGIYGNYNRSGTVATGRFDRDVCL